jgi:uncharacterized damage-inducible protein DinB
MSTIHSLVAACRFNRTRTMGLLDRIEQEPNPQQVLAWRPGPGRAQIREVLSTSRTRLLDTLSQFGDKDLGWVPAPLKERNLSLLDVLHILAWHEGHHQGQAHITLNLYKAIQAT